MNKKAMDTAVDHVASVLFDVLVVQGLSTIDCVGEWIGLRPNGLLPSNYEEQTWADIWDDFLSTVEDQYFDDQAELRQLSLELISM